MCWDILPHTTLPPGDMLYCCLSAHQFYDATSNYYLMTAAISLNVSHSGLLFEKRCLFVQTVIVSVRTNLTLIV